MKRLIILFLCLMLPLSALADGSMNSGPAANAVADVTDHMVYESAQEAGNVVNADESDMSGLEQSSDDYSSPLDVVLVLDCSGSMERANAVNNKSLLSYAQDAAIAFCKTLFSINPKSRVSVVSYESDVHTVSDMQGIDAQDKLSADIRSITLGGQTNTGGGFAHAAQVLDQQAQQDRQRVILLLSDGQANVGEGDPVQYAVQQGTLAAQDSLVYTIGLVGGMSEAERAYTRSTLAAGYETRYFEVDFQEVSDITTTLASAFMSIAVSGSASSDDSVCYCLWVDGSMDVRVENEYGEYLSSALWDYKDTASFGSFYILGDSMDEKMVILREGSYRITLHGVTTATGHYVLKALRGASVTETVLADRWIQTHPAMCQTILLNRDGCQIIDESYDPLDIYAIDPFTGERTRGLEVLAAGRMTSDAAVRGMPLKEGEQIGKLKSGAFVSVLAIDSQAEYYFIAFADENDRASRGWVHQSYLSVDGYVPEMIWLSVDGRVSADTAAYRCPSSASPSAGEIAAFGEILIRHAERDTMDREWVYVQPAGRNCYVYIPSDCIEGWTPQTATGFRLGYATAQYAWRTTLGDGFTEVMWSAPQKGGSGVVLSGRTTSNRAPFDKNRGGRDAFALTMDSDGAVETAVTAGGSALDSYHCIVPAQTGYYISGVTRSNNGDFADTWDASSHTGSAKKTMDRSNALIGHLNDDFSIDWIKSFGSGDASYGFDMVVELADGNIAGVGWMTASKRGTISGHGKLDFYVVKLTPQGEVLKMACYGGGANDMHDSSVATPDGGLIMVGMNRNRGDADGWILVLDSDLNVKNQCTYGGSGEDIFDNIRMLSDGTYLVTGFTDSPSGNGVGIPKGGTDFWAMNIDSMGRSIWVKRYGGSGDEELCGTTVFDDGTCLLVGSTTSADGDVVGNDPRSKDAWAICIDESGRMLWQYASGMSGNDSFNTATVDPADGGYVLSGLCNNTNDDNAKALVVKLQPIAGGSGGRREAR